MPADYICYVPDPDAPAPNELPAPSHDHVTFGCLKDPEKIGPAVLAEWAALMRGLPDSRLFLNHADYASGAHHGRIEKALDEQGIDGRRPSVETASRPAALQVALQRVDIALDTWGRGAMA